jgi:hypothetical protein
MKTPLYVRIILLVLCMLFPGTAAPFPGADTAPAGFPSISRMSCKTMKKTVHIYIVRRRNQ